MMKGIISTLSLLWVLLAGTPTPEKSKVLNKKMTSKEKRVYYKVKLTLWMERNFVFIALVIMLVLLFAFCIFMFWLCGVSAVESGTVYNHMNDII